jgi:Flp pilus assembly protein TadG
MVLGIALLGIVGFALDSGQLYVTKQRAQAAADAGAQAGVMDLYRGNGSAAASASATAYAVKNGFTAAEVDPEYPDCTTLAWCNGHVTLSGSDNPNLIQVTITKVVNTAFLRVLGVNTATVKAIGTAAVTLEPQPVPILVVHPTASGSFSTNGGNTIKICGGPPRSIQVNSSNAASISVAGSGTIDLSHAGPLDPGDCSTGTGADLANVSSQTPYPGTLQLGTKPGQYISKASAIADPLLTVNPPSKPANAPAPQTNWPNGTNGCPASPPKSCTLYSPGNYPSGISVKNETALFKPGIYYMSSGGFSNAANGMMLMATGFTDAATAWTGNMLVYNTGGGTFNVGANSSATLVGSPVSSSYKGILFFQDRRTATNLNHSLGGNGDLTLKGTIYLTHTAASIGIDGTYQSLSLQGTSGGTTTVQGEVIADKLSLGGNSGITMNLISTATFPVRQVALVQ